MLIDEPVFMISIARIMRNTIRILYGHNLLDVYDAGRFYLDYMLSLGVLNYFS